MNDQLSQWTGEFGRAYTERNPVDWAEIVPAWKIMTAHLDPAPRTIFEAGCNRGHNLHALASLFPDARLRGIEPQAYARGFAIDHGLHIENGHLPDPIPKRLASDLVIDSGVLIHVAPENLDASMRALHAASKRWLLSVEYFSQDDAMVHYRGMDDQLWCRDYGAHWQRLFPELRRVAVDQLVVPVGFTHCTYWLMEKP